MLTTPWFERKFNFDFPIGLFPIIVERLRGAVPRIKSIIQNIPEEKLVYKPDGKWSAKEIIGHLYDLEELWNGRIDDFLQEKETLRAADLTNAKTQAANHNQKSVKELLDQFEVARSAFITRIENFDEATGSLTALHPRLQTPMRLIDSLFFTAEHDDHEIAKMRSLIIGH